MQTLKMFLPFVFCFVLLNGRSQNLVPNGSFEVFDTCPNFYGQIHFAVPWNDATAGTVDYYNACSTPYNVPWTGIGYQNAISGNAFVGLAAFYILPNIIDYREYLEVLLTDSLKKNHIYNLSFYTNLCDECGYAVDKIGAYLSDTSIFINSISYLPFAPQVENIGLLSDTANWTQISGYYQAHGGEKYIIIGNFRSDSLTGKILLDSTIDRLAYYYIDSVTVIDCTATGFNEQALDNLLQLAPNPTSSYLTIKAKQTIVIEKAFVYTAVGEKVMEQNANDNENELTVNVATLPKGIYLVIVKTNKGTGYKKVIKM